MNLIIMVGGTILNFHLLLAISFITCNYEDFSKVSFLFLLGVKQSLINIINISLNMTCF